MRLLSLLVFSTIVFFSWSALERAPADAHVSKAGYSTDYADLSVFETGATSKPPCACTRAGLCSTQPSLPSGSSSDLVATLFKAFTPAPRPDVRAHSAFIGDVEPPPPRTKFV